MKESVARFFKRVWAAVERPRVAWILLWAAFALPPMMGRMFMNIDREVGFGLVDLRGLSSDLLIAGLAVAAAAVALRAFDGRAPRVVITLVALLWGLLSYGAFEHVLANDAVIDVVLLKYLGDATFVEGSSEFERPLAALFMAVFPPIAAWRASAFVDPPRPRLWPAFLPLALSWLVVWMWTPNLSDLGWRQQNFIEQAPDRLFDASAQGAVGGGQIDDPRVRAALGRELKGKRLTPVPKKPTNVLVVIVEGMSGAYLPPVAKFHGVEETIKMPKLAARAEREGMWATTFIDPQRQTNRGEFGLLCGDSPKLSSQQSKMSDYADGLPYDCLPAALKKQGYFTAYLQAANLKFMMKDRFMPSAGFDEVLGKGAFPDAYSRSGWGVDDRALYEQVLDRLEGYEKKGKPWFAAVLNVGTHHPFPVPGNWEHQDGETKQSRAYAYTDDAVDRLLTGLEERGLADHTLVVVMSDESQGVRDSGHNKLLKAISRNWGPMLAFGPGIKARRLDGWFKQSDAALSIMDYLGLAEKTPQFNGRSWFRDFEGPRELVFANAHSARQVWITPKGEVIMCKEGGKNCQGYAVDPKRIFAETNESREFAEEERALLASGVAASEALIGGQARKDKATHYELMPKNAHVVRLEQRGKRLMLATGQYLALEDNERLHVRLRYRVHGEGAAVRFTAQLMRRSGNVFAATAQDPVRDGDTVELDFTYSAGKPITDLNVKLNATATQLGKGGASLFLEASSIDIEATEPDEALPSSGIEIHKYELTPKSGKSRKLTWGALGLEASSVSLASCLSEAEAATSDTPSSGATFVGKACKKGKLVSARGSMVNKRSHLTAQLTVKAGRRNAVRGHFEITSAAKKGSAESFRGKSVVVEKGETQTLKIDKKVKRKNRSWTVRFILEADAQELEVLGFKSWGNEGKKRVRAASKAAKKKAAKGKAPKKKLKLHATPADDDDQLLDDEIPGDESPE